MAFEGPLNFEAIRLARKWVLPKGGHPSNVQGMTWADKRAAVAANLEKAKKHIARHKAGCEQRGRAEMKFAHQLAERRRWLRDLENKPFANSISAEKAAIKSEIAELIASA